MSANLLESVRAIREEDPARLSSISREYRGDVETIVAKALEKDKTRRYSSAAALAADHSPIPGGRADHGAAGERHATSCRSSPPAQGARDGSRRGARRAHRRASCVSARRGREGAQGGAGGEAVSDFLQNDLLAQASAATQSGPSAKPDPDLKVRTALDRAAARIGGKFGRQPEVEASIRYTIGRTYLDLGLYPEARTQFDRALDLDRRVLGAENAATLRTLSRVGHTALLQGKYPEAEASLSQALTTQRRVLGAEHPDTLYSADNLAEVYFETGKFGRR